MKKRIICFLLLLVIFFSYSISIKTVAVDKSPRIIACNLSFSDNVYIKYAVADYTDNTILLLWTSPQDSYESGSETASLSPVGTATINGEDCCIL